MWVMELLALTASEMLLVLFQIQILKVFWKPVSATYKKETKTAATIVTLEL